MDPSRRQLIRDERGQTMTEFAIVLPVLCLLLFGVIQFGILFNNYVTLTDAVRAGARKAAVSRQASDPQGACLSQVCTSAQDLHQSKPTHTCTSTWQPAADGTVTATDPYSINLMGDVIAAGPLNATTTDRGE